MNDYEKATALIRTGDIASVRGLMLECLKRAGYHGKDFTKALTLSAIAQGGNACTAVQVIADHYLTLTGTKTRR